MFATLCLGIINPQTGLLAYANAGHLPLVVIGKSGVRALLNPTGSSVGMDSASRYRSAIARIEPGEVLFGFTDGVTEAMSPEEVMYTRKRFSALLEKPASSAPKLIDRVKADLFNHFRIRSVIPPQAAGHALTFAVQPAARLTFAGMHGSSTVSRVPIYVLHG